MSNVGFSTLSVVPSLRGFRGHVERQIGGDIVRLGKQSGAQYGDNFTRSAGASLRSGLGRAVTLASRAGAVAAGAGAFGILKVGTAYQDTLNIFQAATRASIGQMKRVQSAAIDLGANLTLPATSAADAASAMTELAKGGFSVKDSMTAALGTLQLAAAAQVDGAQAAEIQAAALNQFGLGAKAATRVADTLANTANAAAGEITDTALALSFVGPVAKGLRVPLKATATSIGLLAKNGIIGEKAGTALRGVLAGLAAPSKKARAALKRLGVEAFDSSGKFVGMRSILGQLAKAQKGLTDQQFSSAAAMAFGREPLAAINALASEGTGAFDSMAKAVGRQGGAADLAAAKTKGLRGAFEGVKSQLETVAIQIFTKVEPALSGMLRGVARGIPGAVDALKRFGTRVLTAVQPAIDFLQGIRWKHLAGRAKDGLAAGLSTVNDVWKAIKPDLSVFGSALFTAAKATAQELINGVKVGLNTGDWGPLGKAVAAGIGRAASGAAGLTRAIAAWLKGIDWLALGKAASAAAIPFIIGFVNDLAINFLKFTKEHPVDAATFVATIIPVGRVAGLLEKVLGKLPIIGPILRLLSKAGGTVEGGFTRFILKPIGRFIGFIGRALLDGFRLVFPKAGKELSHQLSLFPGKVAGFAINLAIQGSKMIQGLVAAIKDQIVFVGAQAGLIISRILGVFAKPGKILYDIGTRIIKGLANGIGAGFHFVKDKLGDLTGKLPDWKGPASRDRKILYKPGQMVLQGFNRGLESQFRSTRAQLLGMTSQLAAAPFQVGGRPLAAAGVPAGQVGGRTEIRTHEAPVHIDKVYTRATLTDLEREVDQRRRLVSLPGHQGRR